MVRLPSTVASLRQPSTTCADRALAATLGLVARRSAAVSAPMRACSARPARARPRRPGNQHGATISPSSSVRRAASTATALCRGQRVHVAGERGSARMTAAKYAAPARRVSTAEQARGAQQCGAGSHLERPPSRRCRRRLRSARCACVPCARWPPSNHALARRAALSDGASNCWRMSRKPCSQAEPISRSQPSCAAADGFATAANSAACRRERGQLHQPRGRDSWCADDATPHALAPGLLLAASSAP